MIHLYDDFSIYVSSTLLPHYIFLNYWSKGLKLFAEHQVHTDDSLLFYYGTKVGFVIEDYTAENGFGQHTQKYGTILKANLGIDYDLKEYQKLSFEGSHSQDELHQLRESQVKVGYQYKF